MNTKTLKCIALAALVSTPVVAQIYVAPEGSDEHGDGSMAAPFASLSAARDHLRSIGPAGETVIVRGGTYYLEQPILFDERDNGTSATPVTYRAADNEQPVFIGGTRITGWTAVPGTNYYKAHVENCIITGAGHNNVYVCGYPITNATMNGYTIEAPDFSSPEESYVNKSNTVTNNLCSQSGRLVVGSYGILLYQSGENSITHKGPGSAITATILFRNGRTRVRT